MRIRYLSFWLLVIVMVIVTTGAALMKITAARAILLGFDAGAAVFIVSILNVMKGSSADDMRARATANDPDQHVLLAIAMLLVGVVLIAVVIELTGYGGDKHFGVYLSGVTILFVWIFSNLLLAVHYAHMFFAPGNADDAPSRATVASRTLAGSSFPVTRCRTTVSSPISRSFSA